MSSFNETISIKSLQAGTGTVGVTATPLVGATNNRVYKGVWIRNTDAANTLYVGTSRVTTTENGHAIPPGEIIVLELEDPSEVYVLGSADPTAYSWLAH